MRTTFLAMPMATVTKFRSSKRHEIVSRLLTKKLEDPTVIFKKFGGYVELIATYGV
jgi:hypothetical protein